MLPLEINDLRATGWHRCSNGSYFPVLNEDLAGRKRLAGNGVNGCAGKHNILPKNATLAVGHNTLPEDVTGRCKNQSTKHQKPSSREAPSSKYQTTSGLNTW